MGRTIYASFATTDDAEKAAGALLDHGVRNEDISLVQHGDEETYNSRWRRAASVGADDLGSRVDDYGVNRVTTDYDQNDVNRGVTTDMDVNTDAGRRTTPDMDRDDDLNAKHGISTTTAADAGSGAVKGAVVGVGVGVVAALAALFVPGVGIVAGGGALAAALGGVAATTGAGAAAGALTGYLKDQGMDEDTVRSYGNTITSGGAVLAVSIPSGDCDETEAQQVLTKYGATNINAVGSSLAA